MDGTLEQTGDGPRLRFTRRLGHPREKVWRALTEPEHLAAWFPDTIVVERWEPGAPLRFEHERGAFEPFDGEVLAVEPPAVLELRWGTDRLRFELEPADGGAATTLTLLDTLDAVGTAARDGAGWHVCLDTLELHLDGRTTPWSSSDRWREVHPSYVAALPPEASTIGPPAGAA